MSRQTRVRRDEGILMRRHRLGYLVAAGLLLQAAAYLIGLSVITVLTEVIPKLFKLKGADLR
ncbi:MAG: hypothetical protein M3P38_13345 [Chloroflexota bacterium]|nr:hypothetical protein [Chloroflexota bacterium]